MFYYILGCFVLFPNVSILFIYFVEKEFFYFCDIIDDGLKDLVSYFSIMTALDSSISLRSSS